MHFGIKLLLLTAFILGSQFVKASLPGLIIKNESHQYKVLNLTDYESSIRLEGINFSQEDSYLSFYVFESSELSQLALYQIKNGSKKKINVSKNLVVSTIDYSVFYSGRKRYSIKIEPMMQFEFQYETKDKNTMFLSALSKTGFFNARKVKYEFSLPDDLALSARNKETNSNASMVMDSSYFSDSVPFVPILIHPKTSDKNTFFSSWFADRIDPTQILSENTIPPKLVELATELKREALAKACFEFVKREIKYVDLENGINAIIPRACSEVLQNKLGDCKDMANLLVGLLHYFGFEAYHAISRTNSMQDSLNFPSISLANHMVVALRLNEQWIFLDATEDECLFGDPSLQIIGTEVFLIGKKSDWYQQVPNQLFHKSSVQLNYSIQKPSTKQTMLSMEMSCSGKMNYRFYAKLLNENLSKESLNAYLKDQLKMNWELIDYSISDTLSKLVLSCPLPSTYYSLIDKRQLINFELFMSPKEFCNFFYLDNYPLYDAQVGYSLNTTGRFIVNLEKNNAVSKQISCSLKDEHHLFFDLKFNKTSSMESFQKSDLMYDWNFYQNKPLIVEYENL